MGNKNLIVARKNRNDEFYTQYSDIEKELLMHLNSFEGKVVYCNCDNPKQSNFVRYFALNFKKLKLKKIYVSHLTEPDKGKTILLEINSNLSTDKKGELILNKVKKKNIEGNGSFDSQTCVSVLKQADIVVTNPPYSLFREFLDLLMKHKKKFLIIGNSNALSYVNCFHYIMKEKLWLGYNCVRKFFTPEGDLKEGGRSFWFTNLPVDKSNILKLNKRIKTSEYREYDNYDAIEVSKAIDIPMDYKGVMGVPITFLFKYNPEQFEILGSDYDIKNGDLSDLVKKDWTGKLDRAYLDGNRCYSRILIKNRF